MMVGGKQARDTWLIHLVVWQKATQHCKAITLQLETLKKKIIMLGCLELPCDECMSVHFIIFIILNMFEIFP